MFVNFFFTKGDIFDSFIWAIMDIHVGLIKIITTDIFTTKTSNNYDVKKIPPTKKKVLMKWKPNRKRLPIHD